MRLSEISHGSLVRVCKMFSNHEIRCQAARSSVRSQPEVYGEGARQSRAHARDSLPKKTAELVLE